MISKRHKLGHQTFVHLIISDTLIMILGNFVLPRVKFAEQTYIESDNSAEARFFNLAEDLKLFENVRSATHWINSWTLSRLYVCMQTRNP